MAWDLSDYQTGLRLAEAREVLGDERLAPLMPAYPDWGVTIVDGWPERREGRAGVSNQEAAGPLPPSPRPLPRASGSGQDRRGCSPDPGTWQRRSGLQLVGSWGREVPVRKAPPGQRHAPGPQRSEHLVPGGTPRSGLRRGGNESPRRSGSRGRSLERSGLGLHQRHGGRLGLLHRRGESRRPESVPDPLRVGTLPDPGRGHRGEGPGAHLHDCPLDPSWSRHHAR